MLTSACTRAGSGCWTSDGTGCLRTSSASALSSLSAFLLRSPSLSASPFAGTRLVALLIFLVGLPAASFLESGLWPGRIS